MIFRVSFAKFSLFSVPKNHLLVGYTDTQKSVGEPHEIFVLFVPDDQTARAVKHHGTLDNIVQQGRKIV